MFYLSTDKAVIASLYPKVVITKDDNLPAIATIDLNTKIVTINLHNNSVYSDFSEYFICKVESTKSEVISLNEGIYELLMPICINGFTLARSEKTLDKTFNQFLFDPKLEKSNSIILNSDSINIVINVGMNIDSYIRFINASNLFYVLDKDKPMITTTYGIILSRTRNINIRSCAKQIISNKPILIEEADYITALILELKELYPEVQFYNSDQDINDTKYNEFVRYKSYLGDFSNEILTTRLFEDPIYGSVIRTTCKIDFEYHTNDIVRYNARRYDYHINKFLSNKTTATLEFPLTDRKLMFSVHWDRASLIGKDEYSKQTELNSDKKNQYTFQSKATLTVTIYRLSSKYSAIKQILLKEESDPNNVFLFTQETNK